MGKLFYIMGKSATGKDTIYEELLSRKELDLHPFIIYTTRPIRAKETDGVQYHFVTQERMRELEEKGRIIELRHYNVVPDPGIWYYFTVDDDEVDLSRASYLGLGTLESFQKIRAYYQRKYAKDPEPVIPIYIEVADRLRLERAMKREGKQKQPDYAEMCRRYLADQEDFSEEKIRKAGISKRFANDEDRRICMDETAAYIREMLR